MPLTNLFEDIDQLGDPDQLSEFLKEKLRNYPPILERDFKILKVDEENDQKYQFRIMQWNILARGLWWPEPTTDCTEKLMEDFVYDWPNYRLWRTLQEMTRYKSDIICIQEADVYEELKPYLHLLGYTSVFQPKSKSPCLNFPGNVGPDGCAIFYRKSMFQIQSMSCEKIVINSEINSQVFIILQLLHRPSGKLITVVCLHLKSKVQYAEKREAQIKEVLGALSLSEIGTHPVLMCGDFNGEPFEAFYPLVVEDGKLEDAYTADDGNKKPTTIKLREGVMLKRAIDYIFYSKKSLKVKSFLEIPIENEKINLKGLPNGNYSSDHLSLVCDFTFLE